MLRSLAFVAGVALFTAFGGVPIAEAGNCDCRCQGPGGATAPSVAACSTDLECTYSVCSDACRQQGMGYRPGATAEGGRSYLCVGGVDISDGLTLEEQQRIDQSQQANPPAPERRRSRGGATNGGSEAPAPDTAPAPAQVQDATPRGTCSFSCQPSAGGAAVVPRIIVPCTQQSDCQAACTNRCPVPGPSERDAQNRPTNGLPEGRNTNLVCAPTPEPRCVFPAGTDAPAGADTAASGAGDGSEGGLRFVLPSCIENGNCSLTDIINTGIRAANFLIALSGLVFLATVLWAGAHLLFFAQDAKSISKAQTMLTSASIAMVIIMVAGVAVRFVSSSLQVTPSLLEAPGRSANAPSGTGRSATRENPSTNGAAGGAGGASNQGLLIQRPPSNGSQGTCTCEPSGLAGLFAGVASEDQIAQARSMCEGEPINGRFDAGARSCTASATEAECSRAETEINGAIGMSVVSCSWR